MESKYELVKTEGECGICGETLELISPKGFKNVTCIHAYCLSCWKESGKRKPYCPYCRHDLTEWMEYLKIPVYTEKPYDDEPMTRRGLLQLSGVTMEEIDSMNQEGMNEPPRSLDRFVPGMRTRIVDRPSIGEGENLNIRWPSGVGHQILERSRFVLQASCSPSRLEGDNALRERLRISSFPHEPSDDNDKIEEMS